MLDFLRISEKKPKRGTVVVYPKFLIRKTKDLMTRGGDFYAVWVEDKNVWSTDENDAISLIDNEIDKYVSDHKEEYSFKYDTVIVSYMYDASSCMIDNWHKYCQKQRRDAYTLLDETLIFANMESTKKDYATKKLPYPLLEGRMDNYLKLMNTLYSDTERHKLEWSIGGVVCGASKTIQKFVVLYGSGGTGKSTVLNLIEDLFDGYYAVFDAKALGSSSNSFALEAFKSNPLVAIQHDGDLSKISDNTRLNSLVSHEMMTVNEKFKTAYANKFICFLFMGTNKPVKITDAKSGLIRRLIDVSPTGNLLPGSEYRKAVAGMKFELGAIAKHCEQVYLDDPTFYDAYIPKLMLGASNDFYNFIEDSYFTFLEEDGVTLTAAYAMYKTYNEEANVKYPMPKRAFKEELKNYFETYNDRITINGVRIRSYYEKFKHEKFEAVESTEEVNKPKEIIFDGVTSEFDKLCAQCPAQYTTKDGSPLSKWINVKTTLKDIVTSKLHYVQVPNNHIVLDFDITDEDGNKSLPLNMEAALKFPQTYTEVSKSGAGIHLHYIYEGDVSKLSRVYDDHIEIKVFTGNSSLRRKLTKFNSLPINSISSGLPLKGETKVINFKAVKNEQAIRTLIMRNLNKEIHSSTKSSIDFIFKILENAYDGSVSYDVNDLRNAVFAFAASSTNQSEYCMNLVGSMQFKSKTESTDISEDDKSKIIFYDVEVFPNLFLINWKVEGKGKSIVRMINPTPTDVENLIQFKLVGFNCRWYDNHILYGRLLGYNNKKLYELSQKIINNKPNAHFGEAWNISYTDVYDFSSKKQSLKKFEIELGIHHKELGLPWDQPVPESKWLQVAEYCDNDVIATEAVFNARHSDWVARKILAELTGMSVNSTTNSLSTKFIFGNDKTPQAQFKYRNLGEVTEDCDKIVFTKSGRLYDNFANDEYTIFNKHNEPVFPGYKYEYGVSTYRDEVVGEGGYVYSEPGMYKDVALLDIASMHPTTIIVENLFGKYTKRFKEVVQTRLCIKHKDFKTVKTLLNGVLEQYLNDEEAISTLAYGLKMVINPVYGLTSAKFPNAFKDDRNIDNIVAKRGALFMINLKHAVQERGFTVAHIKTDSIKIPNATPEIIEFVQEYGKQYGYNFEHEATYSKMCLINDAVYIAKDASDGHWTATGSQFAVPYVFKTLFSKEDIIFDDLCETKAVTSALYLDLNEKLPDVTSEEKERAKIWKSLLSDTPVSNEEEKKLESKLEQLDNIISGGHCYKFIGKVGRFTPMVDGCNGGHVLRETKATATKAAGYGYANGTKGYRWLESETVKGLNLEKGIDRSYYNKLVDDALACIQKYGDAESFMAN